MIKNKTYTVKQNQILERACSEDWYMMINHGGVRGGKTVINNDLFLIELIRAKKHAESEGIRTPMYILAAYSSSTLQTNILQELTNKYGIDFKFDKHNNFMLFGVKVITTFTSSISGLGAIRGLTAYGAYINEASLANRHVFNEIMNRCSGEGARIICDTNPDHPKHWLKVDYIDKADDKRIIANHFTVFDNTFLPKRYIENLVATTPSGTFTERDIYGRWVIGEGAIYSDFDEDTMVISDDEIPYENFEQFIVGVDWGYRHKGVMLVVGIDSNGVYYVIEEHAHEGKHIDEWLAIASRIKKRYGYEIPFYCDSARAEYVDALYDTNSRAINAYKQIIPGIAEVAKIIKQNQLMISNRCYNLLDEIHQYVWNKNGDRPVDSHDDSMDALRYAIYSHIREGIDQPQMQIYTREGGY